MTIIGDALVETLVPKVEQPRAPSYEGEGYAIIKHATTEGATELLEQMITRIRAVLG